MYRAQNLASTFPADGIRSVLPGGNTVGGWIREKEARDDGYRHVDTPATIAMLKQVNANHFSFGIWDSPTDWDDLRLEFAPAAQAENIQIMPYIVPPTETRIDGRASRPHIMDYVAWAKSFAELSVQYPVLTAWAIDDFDQGMNSGVFTGEYLSEIREAQDAINPALGFFTCAYFAAATSKEFIDRYAPYIDGLVFPFLDGLNTNTVVAETAQRDLDAILELTRSRDLGVLFLVYAGRFLDGVLAPNESYVGEVIRQAMVAGKAGKVHGVIAYGLQVDGAPTVATELRSMYGLGRGALASSRSVVARDTYAELKTSVKVDPDSARYELSFWHNRQTDLRFVPSQGDYIITVLVDGALVWQSDVVNCQWTGLWIQGEPLQGPIDVTSAFAGKVEAELAFRLTALKEVRRGMVDVGIDNIETVGFSLTDPGFEDASAWVASSSGGPIISAVDIFTPDRPERILARVGEEFERG